MATGIRSLIVLQFRQMLRTQFRDRLVSNIVGAISFWIFECILYFIFKEKGVAVPPLAVVIIALSFMITEFIFKLIYVPDNTVMDAYLKTRPVSQQKWDRFLTLMNGEIMGTGKLIHDFSNGNHRFRIGIVLPGCGPLMAVGLCLLTLAMLICTIPLQEALWAVALHLTPSI